MIKKTYKWNNLILVLILLQLMLALAGFHGYAAADNVLVDVMGMVAFMVALLCPYALVGYRDVYSFFRLMTMYLAFMPSTNVATLGQLFDGRELLVVRFAYNDSLELLSSFPRETLPLIILLGCMYIKKGLQIKKWHIGVMVLAVLPGMGMLFLPELSEVLLYWVSYLFVIIAYALLEGIFAVQLEKYEKILLWAIVAVFFGRGCCRLLMLLAVYPLVW